MGKICKIDGCDKSAYYKKENICQMHYFRRMRNGSFEKKQPIYKFIRPNGYAAIKEPDHPLSDKLGYVLEHRFMLFNKIGEENINCDICGKPWSWFDNGASHVDHIDNNRLNNALNNLRPLCNACNTRRDLKPSHTRKNCKAIEYKGMTMTAQEWGETEHCAVSGWTLRQRLKAGWGIDKAFTTPSRKFKKAD